jgi:hypothetical protein
MKPKQHPDLLSSLRAMDDHWGQTEPNPAFEQRLLLRLQPAPRKNKTKNSIFPWFRQYSRSLAFVFAAAVVFLLSVSDHAPTARSGIIIPQIPDAAVEPVETPPEERLEPANPHFDDGPQVPRINPMDPSDPRRLDGRPDNGPVFPAQPDSEWEPESTYSEPNIWRPAPYRLMPKSTWREGADILQFSSPGQTTSMESQTRTPSHFGMSGGTGSTRSKSPVTSSAPCYSKEALMERATSACEESGMTLSDIVYINPCKGGLYQYAEHECTEIVPDEDPCKTGTVSDGDQCTDPGELKMIAYTACKMAMLDMVEFTYTSDDCGWKTRKATYTCCPYQPEPPAPPPVQPVCQGEIIGDGVKCLDVTTIKEKALAHCQALGQMLTDVYPAMNCPNGDSSLVKITCCNQ